MSDSSLLIKLSVRLFRGEKKCFGPGAAQLLEGVERHGSLRAAATEMGMAYSNAWTTLRSCEKALGVALMTRKSGGQSGGSSTLTESGKRLLEGYRRMEEKLRRESETLLRELVQDLPQ